MDESLSARYWCHMCSQIVNPILQVEIKCPHCNNAFVEEMNGIDIESDRALSLWASILLEMIDSSSRRQRFTQEDESDPERTREGGGGGGERVSLINPFNQEIILEESNYGSLSDYLIGPGLDLLLQHLGLNDSNQYGSPPAEKAAVEAMPTVKMEEKICCPVCLEEIEVGEEVREMPCKHRFHGGCILSWLEIHSSCPICRFQMAAEGFKDSGGGGDGDDREEEGDRNGVNGGNGGNGRRFGVPFLWPLNGFFSLSGSDQQNNGNSGSVQPSSSSESGRNSDNRGR